MGAHMPIFQWAYSSFECIGLWPPPGLCLLHAFLRLRTAETSQYLQTSSSGYCGDQSMLVTHSWDQSIPADEQLGVLWGPVHAGHAQLRPSVPADKQLVALWGPVHASHAQLRPVSTCKRAARGIVGTSPCWSRIGCGTSARRRSCATGSAWTGSGQHCNVEVEMSAYLAYENE